MRYFTPMLALCICARISAQPVQLIITPPVVPATQQRGEINVSAVDYYQAAFSWLPVIGASPIQYYQLNIDGTIITVHGTDTLLTGLSSNTMYTVKLRHVDIFGRVSDYGPINYFTTLGLTQLATPTFRSELIGHNYYYLTWDTVTNAIFYIVEKSLSPSFNNIDTIHKGGGPVVADYVLSNTTYYYRVKAINPFDSTIAESNYLIRTITTPAEVVLEKPLVYDLQRTIFDVNQDKTVTKPGGFTPADVGKIITINGARYAKWFSEDVLAWNGHILDVQEGVAIVGTLWASAANKHVGDTLAELIPCVGCDGHYGTNNFDAIRDAIVEANNGGYTTLRFTGGATDTALVDPYRSVRWFNSNWQRFMRAQPADSIGWVTRSTLRVSNLNMIMSCKDYVGKVNTSKSTGNQTFPIKVNTLWNLKNADTKLIIDSSNFIYEDRRNRVDEGMEHFLDLRNNYGWSYATDNRWVMFVNSRLMSRDSSYSTGWDAGFIGPASTGVKTDGRVYLYIKNSLVQSSSPLGAWTQVPRVGATTAVGYYKGTQITIINSHIDGSARPNFTIWRGAQITERGIRVDSVADLRNKRGTLRYYHYYWRDFGKGGRAYMTSNGASSGWAFARFAINQNLFYTVSPLSNYHAEFIYKYYNDTPVNNLSLNLQPPVPHPTEPVTKETATGSFAANAAGSYYYGVTAYNEGAESAFQLLGNTPITINEGEAAVLKFSRPSAYPAKTRIRIWRSERNPGNLDTTRFFVIIDKDSSTVTGSYDVIDRPGNYRDRNLTTFKPHVSDNITLVFGGNPDQPAQVGDGHVLYPNSHCEYYWRNVTVTNSYKLLIRTNYDASSEIRGGNQFYLGNIRGPVSDTSNPKHPFKEVFYAAGSAVLASGANLFGSLQSYYDMVGDSLKSYLWLEDMPNLPNHHLMSNSATYGGGIQTYILNSTVGNMPFPRSFGGTRQVTSYVKNSTVQYQVGTAGINQRARFVIDNRDSASAFAGLRYRGQWRTEWIQRGGRGGFWIDNDDSNRVYHDSLFLTYDNVRFGRGAFSKGTNHGFFKPFVEQGKYRFTAVNPIIDLSIITHVGGTALIPAGTKANWPNSTWWGINNRAIIWNARMFGWGAFNWLSNSN